MANDLSRRPWILDTASADPVKSGLSFVYGFVFRDYGTAGDQAIFQDSRGITIVSLLGDTDLSNQQEIWVCPQVIRDLTLVTLDSGVVEVLIK